MTAREARSVLVIGASVLDNRNSHQGLEYALPARREARCEHG